MYDIQQSKHQPSSSLLQKWQTTINIIEKIFDVPSVVITQLQHEELTISISNVKDDKNMPIGAKVPISQAFCCRRVLETQELLYVSDTSQIPNYETSLEALSNTFNYLGLPIRYPDGELFGTLFLRNKSKSSSYNEQEYQLFRSFQATIEGSLADASNIQKQKKKVSLLMQAKATLAQLNSIKDQLFSSINQDFHIPLTNTLEMLEYVYNNKLPLEQTDHLLNDLIDDVKYSSCFLDNLLNWAKIKRKEIEAQPSIIHLHKIVEQNIALYQLPTNQKQIQIKNRISANAIAYADYHMIDLVIRNLIANAVKFTNLEGSISINATMQPQWITISVCDTGVGIAPEQQKQLFQLNSPPTLGTHQEKGIGLGLLLVQEFVSQCGGKVWMQSEIDKGSTFSFSIPSSHFSLC